MNKIFVYGAFMTNGRYYEHYIKGNKFVGKGYIEGYTRYFLGGLHGILPEDGKQVPGEVYESDPAMLAKMNHLLNNGTVFTRKMVDVVMENGETLQAETYIWTGSVYKVETN
jgi:gamma-glutamylcyclotransferase (GGCT)/AIG2-like uncharacterized protein YtfP